MVESVDAGAQAAVQAEDLAVDQGGQGQVVEQVLQKIQINILSGTKKQSANSTVSPTYSKPFTGSSKGIEP